MTKTAVGFDTVLMVLGATERVNTRSAKAPGRLAPFGLENPKILVFSVGHNPPLQVKGSAKQVKR